LSPKAGIGVMMGNFDASEIRICIKGGGDIGSGVAWRLYHCGFKVFVTETRRPMAVRRKVAFSEAVYDQSTVVEGVEGRLVQGSEEIPLVWEQHKIPVLVDPSCRSREMIEPHVVVDAILAKKNLGTTIHDAPLVIALGPGFEAGKDAHFVVETNRGHRLGRLLTAGSAEPDTGVPGPVLGITTDRVLRAPGDGLWKTDLGIGNLVKKGERIGSVSGISVNATVGGVLRGLIRPGIPVKKGLKIGDIDPRGNPDHCDTISEKALAVSGGILEAILRCFAG